jgi:hypothetical protein
VVVVSRRGIMGVSEGDSQGQAGRAGRAERSAEAALQREAVGKKSGKPG